MLYLRNPEGIAFPPLTTQVGYFSPGGGASQASRP